MDRDRATAPINVAIACQGGGSQTAFTAGALSWLFKKLQERGEDSEVRIVALSGTSGGAVSAALAWRDLLLADPKKEEVPTVERFWKRGYPDGNAALPFPSCVEKDWEDFWSKGTLPWLRTVDRIRSDASILSTKVLETALLFTPNHAVVELKPFYFSRVFNVIDNTPPGWFVNEVFKLAGQQLRAFRDMPIPVARCSATLIGDILDLLPFHNQSVIRDGEPALIRREFDVQDAFRSVLAKYFDEKCLKDIKTKIDARRGSGNFVPELLIGTTDAERVRDARDSSSGAGTPSGKTDPDVQKAKAKALALEEHEHHRASYSNFRIFRASERPDQIVNCVLASAAIPTLMRGVELDHTTLWDGLYSTNPPIYNLPDVHGVAKQDGDEGRNQSEYNPDEIWVIRINPTQTSERPDDISEIIDRRNELAGNLSLTQEIRNVIQIGGATKNGRSYKPITFGFIDMSERVAADLDYYSKMNKSREQIDLLFDDGCRQMKSFYERWLSATEDDTAAKRTPGIVEGSKDPAFQLVSHGR